MQTGDRVIDQYGNKGIVLTRAALKRPEEDNELKSWIVEFKIDGELKRLAKFEPLITIIKDSD